VQIIVVLVLMLSGYGLVSLLIVNLSVCVVSIIITLVIAKKILPEIQLAPKFFSRPRFGKMGVFGIQMQISRLASFAAEKYDEFLLGIFTNLANVTFYNVGNKISSYGRIISLQVSAPIAPASAELSAKGETGKLKQLYIDCTKYLNAISIPIFVYMLVFADKIILAWLGSGYEISAVILRILAAGYLFNFIMSAPGNAIIPNTGIPKYQMFEGLIGLSINLLLSYLLIRQYGILGAAIGNLAATIGASSYLFYKSNNFFGTNILRLVKDAIVNPFLSSLLCAFVCYGLYFLLARFIENSTRAGAIFLVILNISVFSLMYLFLLFKTGFFNERDITFFSKFFSRVPFINMALSKKRENPKIIDEEIF
jgi:O-antigen/teichoic acid export membrane protein